VESFFTGYNHRVKGREQLVRLRRARIYDGMTGWDRLRLILIAPSAARHRSHRATPHRAGCAANGMLDRNTPQIATASVTLR